MKTFLKAVFLIAFLNSFIFAQNKDSPRLIDEFGKVNSEELTVRMEIFRNELKLNPDAKGYVIIYRDKDLPFGFPIRFAAIIQNFLVQSLRLTPERFEIINAGLSDNQKTKLWIVPDRGKPPVEESIDEKLEPNKSALFDSFYYPTRYDGMGCCSIDGYTEEAKKASLDKFAQQLKEQPTAKAYLIFYGQYCIDCSASARYSRSGKYLGLEPDIYLDSSRTVSRILGKEKNYLYKRYSIDKSRIITINGGYRKWQEIELWIVPNCGEIPKPKPNAFPKKRRSKK